MRLFYFSIDFTANSKYLFLKVYIFILVLYFNRNVTVLISKKLEWHKERMRAKDDEIVKFVDHNDLRKAAREKSIRARTTHSELNKNLKSGMLLNRF